MRSRKAKQAAIHRSDCASKHLQARHELERLEQGAGLRADFSQSQVGYLDRRIRDMYFGVESADMRRKLISTHRAWVTLGNELTVADVEDSKERLEDARRDGTITQEIIPPLLGILAVYLGSRINGLTGAIGGGVVGIFVGFSYLRSKTAEREFYVAWEQSSLDDAIKTKSEDYPYPHRFTEREADTGERDDDYEDVPKSGTYA